MMKSTSRYIQRLLDTGDANAKHLVPFWDQRDYWLFSNRQQPHTEVFKAQSQYHIEEEDSLYKIYLTAPGLKSNDFNITTKHGLLTLSYDSDGTGVLKGVKRKYKKSFTLPENCNHDDIEAKYESGILIVTLPKSEDSKPRTIKVA